MAKSTDGRQCIYVFENQRHKAQTMTSMPMLKGAWTESDLSKHSQGLLHHSDISGTRPATKDCSPLEGHRWCENWAIDYDLPGGAVDDDCLLYTSDAADE